MPLPHLCAHCCDRPARLTSVPPDEGPSRGRPERGDPAEGFRPGRPVSERRSASADRGHIAARARTSSPNPTEDPKAAARERRRMRRYEFAVQAALGPSVFHRTKARTAPRLTSAMLKSRRNACMPSKKGVVHDRACLCDSLLQVLVISVRM